MTMLFPKDPSLTGWMHPFGAECDAPDLVIEGELPVRQPAGFHSSWVPAEGVAA